MCDLLKMSGGGGSGASNGPVPAVADSNTTSAAPAEQPWQRAWSLEEMRRGAHDWSLASDAGVRATYISQFQFSNSALDRQINRIHSTF